jgi:hypothetical protein
MGRAFINPGTALTVSKRAMSLASPTRPGHPDDLPLASVESPTGPSSLVENPAGPSSAGGSENFSVSLTMTSPDGFLPLKTDEITAA